MLRAVLICAAALVALVSSVPVSSANGYDWTQADNVLEQALKNKAFPGCVALVGDRTGVLHASALGSYTYGIAPPLNHGTNPPIKFDTIFDMASCTKVTATTTAIAQFYQRGELDLDAKIGDIIGEEFNVNGKKDITVRNCLLHNAGFAPDPSPFWNTKNFGCPETSHEHPEENFSCMEKIWGTFVNSSLINPIGEQYVYSDLSFITLMFVVGELAQKHAKVYNGFLLDSCAGAQLGTPVSRQCYFEAYVRLHVVSAAGMTRSGFLPHGSIRAECAPTLNDTTYMHTTDQGVVHDGNTYAMGGISGHAGLFSTALDMFLFGSKIMWAGEDDSFMNKTTAAYFTAQQNKTQSSRGLGWNVNDHTVPDEGFDQSCGSLSPRTWMHDGYTGTMICGDPERQVVVILLTNRVYPFDTDIQIRKVRKDYTSAVQQILDSAREKQPLV